MKITGKHIEAAHVLAMGDSYDEAARAAGVHVRTIANWLQKEEFRDEVDRVLSELRVRAGRKAWKVIMHALEEGDKKTARWLTQNTEFKREAERATPDVHLHLGYGAREAPPEVEDAERDAA